MTRKSVSLGNLYKMETDARNHKNHVNGNFVTLISIKNATKKGARPTMGLKVKEVEF